jgi:hypothetical protein
MSLQEALQATISGLRWPCVLGFKTFKLKFGWLVGWLGGWWVVWFGD